MTGASTMNYDLVIDKRTLDALVAANVMGWLRIAKPSEDWRGPSHNIGGTATWLSPDHVINGVGDWGYSVPALQRSPQFWSKSTTLFGGAVTCASPGFTPANIPDELYYESPHTAVPRYSLDIATAWTVIAEFQARRFSERRQFFQALKERAVTPEGALLAWPDALGVMGARFPEMVCRAALTAHERMT